MLTNDGAMSGLTIEGTSFPSIDTSGQDSADQCSIYVYTSVKLPRRSIPIRLWNQGRKGSDKPFDASLQPALRIYQIVYVSPLSYFMGAFTYCMVDNRYETNDEETVLDMRPIGDLMFGLILGFSGLVVLCSLLYAAFKLRRTRLRNRRLFGGERDAKDFSGVGTNNTNMSQSKVQVSTTPGSDVDVKFDEMMFSASADPEKVMVPLDLTRKDSRGSSSGSSASSGSQQQQQREAITQVPNDLA